MNLYELITLNKHSDFEEVLFSSSLSYLLNPKFDHGLKSYFLSEIVKLLKINDFNFNNVEVISEKKLNEKGNIDVYVETDNVIIGIEIKIWDRSAKNKSTTGTSQLIRYCEYLSNNKKKNWFLIFLIPNEYSEVCINEHKIAVNNENYRDKVKMLTWNPITDESTVDVNNFLPTSISGIIDQLFVDIKRSLIPLNTQWILDSLLEVLPNLQSQIKEKGRFPNTQELKNTDFWNYFEPFYKINKKCPNPIHTVVGIPYGNNENRINLHNNCLYRIRTTKKYYNKTDEKDENLPNDAVELEIWPDIYNQIQEDFVKWMNKNNLEDLKDGIHLDKSSKTPIKILRINKHLSEEVIREFEYILRIGASLLSK